MNFLFATTASTDPTTIYDDIKQLLGGLSGLLTNVIASMPPFYRPLFLVFLTVAFVYLIVGRNA